MPTDTIVAAAVCVACGTELPTRAKFCGECGHPAAAASGAPAPRAVERMLAAASILEGERKLVTVLFADLRGSTELIADRDPEEARRLLCVQRLGNGVWRVLRCNPFNPGGYDPVP